MASLFSNAIVAFCAGTAQGQYNAACTSAVDASTRQVGWRQTADSTEDKTVQYVNTKVQQNAPKPLQDVAGTAGFLYKTAKERKLSFKLPTFGLASSVRNEITLNTYTLTIDWRFP